MSAACYPATQAWKRQRLKAADIAVPASLTFAPVDFERQSLADGLTAAGFRADRPAFFQWLGVTPYLTREAVTTTLDFVAGLPQSEVVFDYTEPIANYPPARRANLMAIAERAASRGEPWLSLFDPAEMASLLRARGFDHTEDHSRADIAQRYYGEFNHDDVTGAGPHMVRAKSR